MDSILTNQKEIYRKNRNQNKNVKGDILRYLVTFGEDWFFF